MHSCRTATRPRSPRQRHGHSAQGLAAGPAATSPRRVSSRAPAERGRRRGDCSGVESVNSIAYKRQLFSTSTDELAGVVCQRKCGLEGQTCSVKVHDERHEADTYRHTPCGLYHLLDVDGTENSEEGRSRKRNGMAVPRVRNAFCPSGTLPLGWSLSTELGGVEERRIRGY